MNSDVTFLISSCDKYEDAWEPFFRLAHIMGVDKATENPFVLNTETKKYECDFMKVRTINSDAKLTWSQRMIYVLKQIDTEYVFLLLEDFFIQEPFNLEYFQKVINYLREHEDVGAIHTTPSARFKDIPEQMFYERTFEELNITVTAVIWRKSFLLKLLKPHENIWQFEWYSGLRAKKFYSEKIIQYNQKYPIIFNYKVIISEGYGITESKWLPKNKELFEKYGIKVKFDNLGFYEPHDVVREPITISNFPKRLRKHIRAKISGYKSLKM